jgi:hypothetical protein
MMQHGTSRRLVCRSAHASLPRFCHDDARRTYDLSRTHDSTKVALVRHMVQQKHKRIALTCRSHNVGKIRILKRLYLKHDALMCPMRRTAIQAVATHILDTHVGFLQASHQLVKHTIALSRAYGYQRATQRNMGI